MPIVNRLLEEAARGELVELAIPPAADVIQGAVAPPLYRYQRHECGYSPERMLGSVRLLLAALRRTPPAKGHARSPTLDWQSSILRPMASALHSVL